MATIEELNEKIEKLAKERDALVADLKKLTAQRNKIEAEQTAEQLIAGMNEDQKAAVLHVMGIPPESKLGNIGNG